MKTKITSLALFLSISSLFSQNWAVNQTVQPLKYIADTSYLIYGENMHELYSNYEFYYSNIIIDSTLIYNDTSYYFYNNDFLLDTNDILPYFNKYFGCILGSKSYSLPNNDSYFIFKNDTFLLKSSAIINETWHFLNSVTGNYIEAKILNIDTLTTFNGIDSVKYIELNMRDDNNNIIVNTVNGTEIILSKNNGIISIPDLRKIKHDIINHNLVKNSTLTYGSVNNFEIGDEFHYNIESAANNIAYDIYVEIRTVISKTYSQNNDTIYYQVDRAKSTNGATYSYNQFHTHDTIGSVIANLDTVVSSLPLNSTNSLQSQSEEMFTTFSFPKYNNRLTSKIYVHFFTQLNDSIYTPSISCKSTNIAFGNINSITTYINGCGVIYNSSFIPYGQAHAYTNYHESLVYYKKGNEVWGTPLVILEDRNIIKESDIKIYPNPSKDVFTISNTNRITKIEVYNTLGSIVYTKNNINSNKISINLEKQNTGIYFIKIFSKNTYIAKKIIKK